MYYIIKDPLVHHLFLHHAYFPADVHPFLSSYFSFLSDNFLPGSLLRLLQVSGIMPNKYKLKLYQFWQVISQRTILVLFFGYCCYFLLSYVYVIELDQDTHQAVQFQHISPRQKLCLCGRVCAIMIMNGSIWPVTIPQGNPRDMSSSSGPWKGNCLQRSCPGGRRGGGGQIKNRLLKKLSYSFLSGGRSF